MYRYIFAHARESDPTLKAFGAGHTIEHTFIFPGLGKYQSTDSDRAVQRRMVGYWSRMARTGNPNGGEDPQWPAYTPGNDAYLEIGAITATKKGPADAMCDFWDTVTFPWPHL